MEGVRAIGIREFLRFVRMRTIIVTGSEGLDRFRDRNAICEGSSMEISLRKCAKSWKKFTLRRSVFRNSRSEIVNRLTIHDLIE